MRLRVATAVLVVSASTAFAPAAVGLGAQASAQCGKPGEVSYVISDGTRAWMATNLHSDYLRGPGNIIYSKTATSTTDASVTGTTTAEAGVIFAKASVALGVTVGKSWSKSDTWTYNAQVAAGQTKRLQQYKEGRGFTVKKTTIAAPCTVQTVWTKHLTAPVHNDTYLWALSD